MKYIDEYRDRKIISILSQKIKSITKKKWKIMEVCGGQTHSIMKYNLEEFLPSQIELIHGPGCPVCVTPLDKIDKAIYIASQPNVIFTTFGDMMRVPGSSKDLLSLKAEGKDIRMVYSPLDVLNIVKENPKKQIVFFSIGFETTAPASALTIFQAKKRNIKNFSTIVSHVLVPPAMETILNSSRNNIQGFLAAGHVCTIMGYKQYIPIAKKFLTPIVITGFEPVDILQGIFSLVNLLENKEYVVTNEYSRSVNRLGNLPAQKLIKTVFRTANMNWRGIGMIKNSGFTLADEYKEFDAEVRFGTQNIMINESEKCIAGEILQGLKKPYQCEAFKKSCHPENPLGAPMVSQEGACSAYYRYSHILN